MMYNIDGDAQDHDADADALVGAQIIRAIIQRHLCAI